MPALSRATVNLNDTLTARGVALPVNLSVRVGSDAWIVAERPLYFKTGLAGGVDGGTDIVGASAPGTDFFFAEGTLRDGFVEFRSEENPVGKECRSRWSPYP